MVDFKKMADHSRLRKEIEQAINKHSLENGSDTPDFILAEYLTDCLRMFDKAVNKREEMNLKNDEGMTMKDTIVSGKLIDEYEHRQNSNFVLLLKPNYQSKNGIIKRGVKIGDRYYAPKSDLKERN